MVSGLTRQSRGDMDRRLSRPCPRLLSPTYVSGFHLPVWPAGLKGQPKAGEARCYCILAWFPSSSLLLPIAVRLDVWSEIVISPRPKCFLLFWWLSRRSCYCLFILSTLRSLDANRSEYTVSPPQLQGLCLWVQVEADGKILGEKQLSSVLNMY